MNDSTTTFTCERDRHLFGPGPKRILALDGGGVRGAITVAFLEKIEKVFAEHYGKEIRLGDHFDLIGGTSTGAIIAGALALGFNATQVKDFYTKLAPMAFKRQRWSIPILQAKFDVRGLRAEIDKVIGDLELQSEALITGLCVVTKRIDTGSPWILANNPKAPYWEDGPGHDGNKRYKLATLVRASTAAPHFFDPELIPINSTLTQLPQAAAAPLGKPMIVRFTQALLERLRLKSKEVPDTRDFGLFIDGGVTPHNNPSFALLQMATLKPFRICWPVGPDRLSVTSIGTGTFRPRLSYRELGVTRFPQLAYHALMSLMTDAEILVHAQMQWLGELPAPWVINSEIGTLADDGPPGGKMFRFMRYDVKLEQPWLQRLGVTVSDRDLARYRGMDDPSVVADIYLIAQKAAEEQVKAEHFFPKAQAPTTGGTASAA